MTTAIRELADWLIEESYNKNFTKAKRLVKVIVKNGHDINYDKLNYLTNNYMLNDILDFYDRATDILKERIQWPT